MVRGPIGVLGRWAGRRVPSVWGRVGLIALVGMVVLVQAVVYCGGIPPRSMTLTAMSVTAGRVAAYYRRGAGLPADLGALPVREGYLNRTADGWGRELIYAVEGADRFSLTSLGRDGVVGGGGEDADQREVYEIVRGEAERAGAEGR